MRTAARPAAAEPSAAADLEAAYGVCEAIARAHYENFPVASRLISRGARRALSAVYAFARGADDLADEGYGAAGPTKEERLRALDAWRERLEAASRGARHHAALADGGAPPPDDGIFLALSDTLHRHGLDPRLFHDLLSAFRQDVVVSEYATREELLDYCRRSADPVGRIVLAVHGVGGESLLELSDEICTGLQLTNFWQDVAVDHEKGRIYLPGEDRARFGVTAADLSARAGSRRMNDLVLEEARWTRGFFERGKGLLAAVPARLRLHLRLVWHGGVRILEMIEESGGDVLARRPSLGKRDWARVLLRASLPVSRA